MVVPESSKKEETLRLMTEKDQIEQKIKEYGTVLEINQNIGMNGPLVDVEGFPRNDIDVYQVRNARHQIICLQNDLKALMKEIEKGIHEIHADAASNGSSSSAQRTTKMTGMSSMEVEDEMPLTPIVKINMLFPSSPAEDAGLAIEDEIIEFGSVNSKNFKNNLMVISDVVKHKVNENILLKVKRGEQIFETYLRPRVWNGRGLLGCQIVPIEKN